ncbi:MAG: NAD(P)/FAD-dependent oxidoreductase, partial [Pseudomonadota bacterium]
MSETGVTERESMEFDVVVVGAGPAGLATACRLKQLAAQASVDLAVVVVEKGAEVGAHILSGNVFEPTALDELFPDWRERGAPLTTKVTSDTFHYMTSATRAWKVPGALIPAPMHNEGNYIISLGRLCQWLAEQAEALEVDLFPGFAAADIIYDEAGAVCGVVTGDMGVDRDGAEKDSYTAGYELRARYVVFAEGCRGHLGKALMERFDLRANADPQHYGIGLKEVWEIPAEQHQEGRVVHTLGWPLDNRTEGGGFLYHAANQQVYCGYIIALDYENPWLSPFEEFQRWKHHPAIAATLQDGKRVAYGARAVNKGGLQSLPKTTFPGGVLVGCDAGFLNGAKIKGSHTAMKTGMLAAEAIFEAVKGDSRGDELVAYEDAVRRSWVYEELHRSRNFGPALHKLGTFFGAAFAFVDQNIARGRLPFTLRNRRPDHESLRTAEQCPKIEYPKPDGKLSFDRLSSVFLSSTN